MEQILPLIAAIVFANVLTASFGYGMWHAFRVREFSELHGGAKACLLVPLLFVAATFLLLGRG